MKLTFVPTLLLAFLANIPGSIAHFGWNQGGWGQEVDDCEVCGSPISTGFLAQFYSYTYLPDRYGYFHYSHLGDSYDSVFGITNPSYERNDGKNWRFHFFPWGSTLYGEYIIGNQFSVEYVGWFKAKQTGTYRFWMGFDSSASFALGGGSNCYTNDFRDGVANAQTFTSTDNRYPIDVKYQLEAGKYYPIRINYYSGLTSFRNYLDLRYVRPDGKVSQKFDNVYIFDQGSCPEPSQKSSLPSSTSSTSSVILTTSSTSSIDPSSLTSGPPTDESSTSSMVGSTIEIPKPTSTSTSSTREYFPSSASSSSAIVVTSTSISTSASISSTIQPTSSNPVHTTFFSRAGSSESSIYSETEPSKFSSSVIKSGGSPETMQKNPEPQSSPIGKRSIISSYLTEAESSVKSAAKSYTNMIHSVVKSGPESTSGVDISIPGQLSSTPPLPLKSPSKSGGTSTTISTNSAVASSGSPYSEKKASSARSSESSRTGSSTNTDDVNSTRGVSSGSDVEQKTQTKSLASKTSSFAMGSSRSAAPKGSSIVSGAGNIALDSLSQYSLAKSTSRLNSFKPAVDRVSSPAIIATSTPSVLKSPVFSKTGSTSNKASTSSLLSSKSLGRSNTDSQNSRNAADSAKDKASTSAHTGSSNNRSLGSSSEPRTASTLTHSSSPSRVSSSDFLKTSSRLVTAHDNVASLSSMNLQPSSRGFGVSSHPEHSQMSSISHYVGFLGSSSGSQASSLRSQSGHYGTSSMYSEQSSISRLTDDKKLSSAVVTIRTGQPKLPKFDSSVNSQFSSYISFNSGTQGPMKMRTAGSSIASSVTVSSSSLTTSSSAPISSPSSAIKFPGASGVTKNLYTSSLSGNLVASKYTGNDYKPRSTTSGASGYADVPSSDVKRTKKSSMSASVTPSVSSSLDISGRAQLSQESRLRSNGRNNWDANSLVGSSGLKYTAGSSKNNFSSGVTSTTSFVVSAISDYQSLVRSAKIKVTSSTGGLSRNRIKSILTTSASRRTLSSQAKSAKSISPSSSAAVFTSINHGASSTTGSPRTSGISAVQTHKATTSAGASSAVFSNLVTSKPLSFLGTSVVATTPNSMVSSRSQNHDSDSVIKIASFSAGVGSHSANVASSTVKSAPHTGTDYRATAVSDYRAASRTNKSNTPGSSSKTSDATHVAPQTSSERSTEKSSSTGVLNSSAKSTDVPEIPGIISSRASYRNSYGTAKQSGYTTLRSQSSRVFSRTTCRMSSRDTETKILLSPDISQSQKTGASRTDIATGLSGTDYSLLSKASASSTFEESKTTRQLSNTQASSIFLDVSATGAGMHTFPSSIMRTTGHVSGLTDRDNRSTSHNPSPIRPTSSPNAVWSSSGSRVLRSSEIIDARSASSVRSSSDTLKSSSLETTSATEYGTLSFSSPSHIASDSNVSGSTKILLSDISTSTTSSQSKIRAETASAEGLSTSARRSQSNGKAFTSVSAIHTASSSVNAAIATDVNISGGSKTMKNPGIGSSSKPVSATESTKPRTTGSASLSKVTRSLNNRPSSTNRKREPISSDGSRLSSPTRMSYKLHNPTSGTKPEFSNSYSSSASIASGSVSGFSSFRAKTHFGESLDTLITTKSATISTLSNSKDFEEVSTIAISEKARSSGSYGAILVGTSRDKSTAGSSIPTTAKGQSFTSGGLSSKILDLTSRSKATTIAPSVHTNNGLGSSRNHIPNGNSALTFYTSTETQSSSRVSSNNDYKPKFDRFDRSTSIKNSLRSSGLVLKSTTENSALVTSYASSGYPTDYSGTNIRVSEVVKSVIAGSSVPGKALSSSTSGPSEDNKGHSTSRATFSGACASNSRTQPSVSSISSSTANTAAVVDSRGIVARSSTMIYSSVFSDEAASRSRDSPNILRSYRPVSDLSTAKITGSSGAIASNTRSDVKDNSDVTSYISGRKFTNTAEKTSVATVQASYSANIASGFSSIFDNYSSGAKLSLKTIPLSTTSISISTSSISPRTNAAETPTSVSVTTTEASADAEWASSSRFDRTPTLDSLHASDASSSGGTSHSVHSGMLVATKTRTTSVSILNMSHQSTETKSSLDSLNNLSRGIASSNSNPINNNEGKIGSTTNSIAPLTTSFSSLRSIVDGSRLSAYALSSISSSESYQKTFYTGSLTTGASQDYKNRASGTISSAANSVTFRTFKPQSLTSLTSGKHATSNGIDSLLISDSKAKSSGDSSIIGARTPSPTQQPKLSVSVAPTAVSIIASKDEETRPKSGQAADPVSSASSQTDSSEDPANIFSFRTSGNDLVTKTSGSADAEWGRRSKTVYQTLSSSRSTYSVNRWQTKWGGNETYTTSSTPGLISTSNPIRSLNAMDSSVSIPAATGGDSVINSLSDTVTSHEIPVEATTHQNVYFSSTNLIVPDSISLGTISGISRTMLESNVFTKNSGTTTTQPHSGSYTASESVPTSQHAPITWKHSGYSTTASENEPYESYHAVPSVTRSNVDSNAISSSSVNGVKFSSAYASAAASIGSYSPEESRFYTASLAHASESANLFTSSDLDVVTDATSVASSFVPRSSGIDSSSSVTKTSNTNSQTSTNDRESSLTKYMASDKAGSTIPRTSKVNSFASTGSPTVDTMDQSALVSSSSTGGTFVDAEWASRSRAASESQNRYISAESKPYASSGKFIISANVAPTSTGRVLTPKTTLSTSESDIESQRFMISSSTATSSDIGKTRISYSASVTGASMLRSPVGASLSYSKGRNMGLSSASMITKSGDYGFASNSNTPSSVRETVKNEYDSTYADTVYGSRSKSTPIDQSSPKPSYSTTSSAATVLSDSKEDGGNNWSKHEQTTESSLVSKTVSHNTMSDKMLQSSTTSTAIFSSPDNTGSLSHSSTDWVDARIHSFDRPKSDGLIGPQPSTKNSIISSGPSKTEASSNVMQSLDVASTKFPEETSSSNYRGDTNSILRSTTIKNSVSSRATLRKSFYGPGKTEGVAATSTIGLYVSSSSISNVSVTSDDNSKSMDPDWASRLRSQYSDQYTPTTDTATYDQLTSPTGLEMTSFTNSELTTSKASRPKHFSVPLTSIITPIPTTIMSYYSDAIASDTDNGAVSNSGNVIGTATFRNAGSAIGTKSFNNALKTSGFTVSTSTATVSNIYEGSSRPSASQYVLASHKSPVLSIAAPITSSEGTKLTPKPTENVASNGLHITTDTDYFSGSNLSQSFTSTSSNVGIVDESSSIPISYSSNYSSLKENERSATPIVSLQGTGRPEATVSTRLSVVGSSRVTDTNRDAATHVESTEKAYSTEKTNQSLPGSTRDTGIHRSFISVHSGPYRTSTSTTLEVSSATKSSDHNISDSTRSISETSFNTLSSTNAPTVATYTGFTSNREGPTAELTANIIKASSTTLGTGSIDSERASRIRASIHTDDVGSQSVNVVQGRSTSPETLEATSTLHVPTSPAFGQNTESKSGFVESNTWSSATTGEAKSNGIQMPLSSSSQAKPTTKQAEMQGSSSSMPAVANAGYVRFWSLKVVLMAIIIPII